MHDTGERTKFFKTLTYANGYRELGMYAEALKELDSLSEEQQSKKEHFHARLAVLIDAKSWEKALPFANRLASSESNNPANLVNLAFVVRRASSLEGARAILESAARHFPNEAIIQYNLGCYSCCDEDLDTAKRHLKRAFELDPSFLKTSSQDEDLDPLSDWLANIANNGS